MASIKAVINDPKTGKSVQREISENDVKGFLGLKLGDTLKGELFGLTGYEFSLTGGSDDAGFPMRKDIFGTNRKRIFAHGGTGIRNLEKGKRIRKTVAGNTVHQKTAQLNLKITKDGKETIFTAKAEDAAEAPKPAAKHKKGA
jgi:small subunit ribosomal protein S6e